MGCSASQQAFFAWTRRCDASDVLGHVTRDYPIPTAGAGDLKKLNMDDITAQVFIFFVAGFDSSAGTTSFTLYEMAKQPAVLAKALEEVDRVLQEHDGKISYESVMSMPYLDKCVNGKVHPIVAAPTCPGNKDLSVW